MKRSKKSPTPSGPPPRPNHLQRDSRALNSMREQITAAMTDWAKNLGIDTSTLKARLNTQGIVYDSSKLSAAQVYKAMVGDKESAMTKKLLADAAKRERENRVAEGELLDVSAIEKKLWVDLLQPLRLQLEQMPDQLSGMCNPENPGTAKDVLRRFVEELKLNLKGSNERMD